MPLTHYPYGVSSFGAPIFPGVPFGGQSNFYYVDAINGNDGNSGTDPSQAFKTVAKGYAVLRSGYYDTLFLIGLGTAFPLTAQLVWAKNYTNLIGDTIPTLVSQRARITNGTALLTPMIDFTATGVYVANIQMANYGSDATGALLGVRLNGAQRCRFDNCHIAGMGGATTATETGGRSLVLTNDASENVFSNCAIGLDTVARTAANYEIEFIAPACARNVFQDCTVLRYTTGSGNSGGFVKIDNNGIDRWVIFRNCIFMNSIVGGGAALTTGFVAGTAQATGGYVLLKNCISGGMTGLTGGSDTSLLVDFLPGAATSVLGLTPTS